MQKDYRPLELEDSGRPEIERVAAYWTSVWADQSLDSSKNTERIEASDEFRVIGPYLAKLPEAAAILDGGCGMGQWVCYLKDRGYAATGIDVSAPTVERLTSAFPGPAWEAQDINSLTFPGGSFDAYLSWGTFEHFEAGLSKPFSEAWRVLKPGGYLFVSVPHDSLRLMPGRYGTDWSRAAVAARTPQAFYQWRLTPKELAFEAARHGFSVEDVTPIHALSGAGRLFQALTKRRTDGPITARIVKLMSLGLPRRILAHMILAVARKPLNGGAQGQP